ncbi:Fe-S cluster assembly protein SufD [Alteromonas flava]|uniref:Fe-S cluster assembly protein SufD n=1 Tax=Alteromonas flava TaxID=2048003 RepID=UPI000C2946CA|nr:Fe-S cluster assembly protein SufD [Alteromonas flava]
MSQWLEQVIAAADGVDDYLSPAREQALAKLKADGWPKARSEAWQFTPLTSVTNRSMTISTTVEAATAPAVAGLEAVDIVFCDGQLVTDIQAIDLPEGVSIVSLATADAEAQQAISALFASVKPERHIFGLVNDTVCQQGVYIDVAANVKVERPLRIVNVATQDIDAHTRVLVNLQTHSHVTVIEHGCGDTASFTTAFAEYSVGEHASLEHYRFAMHTGAAKQVGGSHFNLLTEAKLNSTLVGFGSELSRIDVDIIHAGEHAKAKMNAIYLLAEGELFDLHSTIEHAMPNGKTEENARGIIGDRARAVFNGRIHIHRDAQKTLAELNNRNLLLSRRALVNTKPELEIYADDVQCAHGATVAEIEEKALYYLLSRGIERSKALIMLNFGFIQELVNDMPNAALRDWLTPLLRNRFAEMEVK